MNKPDFTPVKVKRKPLERDLERQVVAEAKRRRILCYKFSSPGTVSVPDRLFIHRGKVIFIELKRPGGKLTEKQKKEHEKLKAAGAIVYTAWSLPDVTFFWNLEYGL